MLRLFILEILLVHVNLVILKHALLSQLTQSFNLCSKHLIFIDFLHESGVLLLLCGVNALGPASLSVEHAFVACADSECVDVVEGELGEVIQFDVVRITEHITLIFFLGFKRAQ